MEEQVTEAEQEVIIANNNLLFYCIARSVFKKASKLRHYFLYNHVKPRHSRTGMICKGVLEIIPRSKNYWQIGKAVNSENISRVLMWFDQIHATSWKNCK